VPRYGFNFQWMFIYRGDPPPPPNEKELDFLTSFGFDYVRVPTDYRFWTSGVDYKNPDEDVIAALDDYLAACQERDLHMNLNLHRAPGYCINRNDLEEHNLWLDEEAQEGFIFLWETFAERYADVPPEDLSFDLVNEPPQVGQYGMTRENHANLMRRTVAAINAISPEREVTIDGLGGGNIAMPELADLDVIHSTRGYQPMTISHYKAGWVEHVIQEWPEPVYPGAKWDGKVWDKDTVREHYAPWREVEERGREIFIGEFGCYNKTPNDVALRWLSDLLELFKEFGWGYALWNFSGPFGIVEHGRPGATYEEIEGFKVDRQLLDLLIEHRVSE